MKSCEKFQTLQEAVHCPVPVRPVARYHIHDLHYVIHVDCFVEVERLLDNEAAVIDVNSTVCGSTALSLSLYKEKYDTFCLLLTHPNTESAIDVNKLSKDDKQHVEPPLVTACRMGDLKCVRLLLSRPELNLEGKDNFANTAIWMATRQRFSEIVELLIAHGASVNSSSQWMHSPLFFATKYSSRRTDIAKNLLLNGASVQLAPGAPSLLFCAIVQGNLGMAKLIVEAGYNVSKDERIRQEFSASMLTRNVHFLEWLKQEMHSAPCLQRQCRNVIRETITLRNHSKHVLKYIGQLPLPSKLIDYISLVGPSYDASIL